MVPGFPRWRSVPQPQGRYLPGSCCSGFLTIYPVRYAKIIKLSHGVNQFNYLEGGRGRKPPAKGINGIGIIGTPIFRPGKGKLFDYPNLSDYSSDYSIDIKYFFNYNNKQGHILFS